VDKTKKHSTIVSRLGRIPAAEIEDRKDRILDSATEVFLEAGFNRATVTAIARKAGCSLETLYSAYPNKEQMFEALIARKATGTFEAMGALSPDRDVRDVLVRFAMEMLVLMARSDTRGLHRLVIGESRQFPEVAKRFWKEGYARSIQVLRDYFSSTKDGRAILVADPNHAAEVFMALLLGDMCMRSTLGLKTLTETKKQQEEWAQSCADLFLTLLEQKKV
jgi:TetR/AcrR family transcriptional repressor of mexJK operon